MAPRGKPRDGLIPTGKGTRYKPSALRGYEETLRLHVLPAVGHIRLADVRRADVQAIADGMTAAGLSASTVHNAINPLRTIYRRAIRPRRVNRSRPGQGA